MFLHRTLPLLYIFVFWGWSTLFLLISLITQLHHNTHTDPYKCLSALTCGDRAVGGWVRSVEWAADRKPCALLTDWCVSGADSTSCWRKYTDRGEKKPSNWWESQPKWSKANLKQPPSWAKKRLKIMRRESGCCVLSTFHVTSLGNFLYVPVQTECVVAVVRVQNSRAIVWKILWDSFCCDCQSQPTQSQLLTGLMTNL